jgi:hypothetical protein
MPQSYSKSALAQQIDVSSQDFFSVLVVGVDDFPGIGAILARSEIVAAIPVVFEVCEFIDEFAPTVIDTDFNF